MSKAIPVVHPRRIANVLVGRDSNGVHITWELGDPVSANPVEFFTYSVQVTGNRGSTLKQFAVKFIGTEDPQIHPYIFDFMGGGQSNYDPNRVALGADSISVHFIDASVGPESIDSATAGLNINGVDLQEQRPVAVVD